MSRYTALILAACLSVLFAMPVQAAVATAAAPAASVVAPKAAAVAASAASPSPAPGAHSQRPRPAGPATRAPKVPVPQGTWNWQNPKPTGNPLFAISCPTATTCFAAGFGWPVEKTIDGGANWNPQGSAQFLNAISCSTASSCVAVGDAGLAIATSDGGATWVPTTINSGNFLSGVSCPAVAFCFAVGFAGSILRSADGGQTWTKLTSGTTHDLFSISCANANICAAVGDVGTITRSTDGIDWSAGTFGSNALFGVSCSTFLSCTAVGDNGASPVTIDGGASWNLSADLGTSVTLNAVSCVSGTSCFAAGVDGSVYIELASGGYGHWKQASAIVAGSVDAISCVSATTCFAAGDYGIVVATTDGGSGWAIQSPASVIPPSLLGVSCPSTSVCIAVARGGSILGTADGGATWPAQTSGVSNTLEGVTCLSTSACFAVGDFGVILVTTNGGGTWNTQTSTVTVNLFGISCPSSTVCFAVGAGGTILTTANAGGTWTAQVSGTTNDLAAISCASISVCTAVGDSIILGTVNGGGTWATQYSIGGGYHQYLLGVSCADTTHCVAVGWDLFFRTSDGGTTWTSTTEGAFFAGVSCATASICFAVGSGGSIARTGDGGVTWLAQVTPKIVDLSGVSCPTTTTCFAVSSDVPNSFFSSGSILATTDGGATRWHFLAPSGTHDSLTRVSCPSATTCFAVGGGGTVLSTTDGGTGWFPAFSLQHSVLQAISCPSVTVCFVVGATERGFGESTIYGTTDGGLSWNSLVAAPTGIGEDGGFYSISCATTTVCYAAAIGGTFVKTVDGTSWSAPQPVTGANGVDAISCPSTSTCFAVDIDSPAHVYTTGNGGATWTLSWNIATDPYTSSTGPLSAIDCPDLFRCFATGANGLIATTSDAGAHWRTDFSGSSADLTGVSCTSTCFVTASDTSILWSVNSGGTWTVQDSGELAPLASVSCVSSETCFAVGTNGEIVKTATHGDAWSTVRPAESTADILGMSCYGSSNCYAAGVDTLFDTHDGGTTWTPTVMASGDQFVAISCPGANTCFAVGWPVAIMRTTNGGLDWSSQPNSLYGSDETLTGISCTSVTSCVAVGLGGLVLTTTNGGASWNHESSGTTGNFSAVSCPSPSSCVAVGGNGLARTRTGATWAGHPSGTTHTLVGVDCVTANTCYAVGTAGTIRVTTNRGVTWAARTSGTSNTLSGIACLQPSYCVADGDFGTVLVTVDGASWKPRATPTFYTFNTVAYPDLNHSWLGGLGGTILANPSLIPSCTSVSIAANQTSPQPIGTVVTLSAAAAGCPDANPQYRFYLRSPSAVWSIVQDFSTSNSFVWNTASYVPGTYLMGVWAKDAKSGFTYDAYAFGTFTLQGLPCTSVNIGSDAASPQTSGATINFTATSAGCPSPTFQWWVRDAASVWSIAVPFASSSSTFAWNTSGLVDGTYQIGVWARQAGSTKSYEAFAFVTYTLTPTPVTGTTLCKAVNVAASPASPRVNTTSVTLTASALGCDTPQYKWWVRDTAAVWHIVQNYPGTSTFVWTGTRPAGTYLLGVWVRQAGSAASYEVYSFITYTLVVAPTNACTSVNIAPDVTSPQAPGTVVTFTAAALGCPSATYKFFVAPPNGTFGEVQAFGASNTFIWNTAGLSPGPWQIGVWARQSGSTSAYQAFAFITYQLTFG